MLERSAEIDGLVGSRKYNVSLESGTQVNFSLFQVSVVNEK